MTLPERVVVFTDLDGTLLDAETYSFDAARPALAELRRRAIPLVPVTSKTAAETRALRRRLELSGPFIVESGAGVYLPEGEFPGGSTLGEKSGDCRLVRLAAGYDEILRGMEEIRERTGGAVRGFHEMSVDDIARETGLPLESAVLAKQREFDEPFRLLRPQAGWPDDLQAAVERRGLRLSRGGRYWHLHGACDKGRAVEYVKSLYRRVWSGLRAVGAGDSELDLPLLQAVDVPILVAKPDGSYDQVLIERVNSPILSQLPGPAGWSRAVLEALELAV